jgi:hypothetical protein
MTDEPPAQNQGFFASLFYPSNPEKETEKELNVKYPTGGSRKKRSKKSRLQRGGDMPIAVEEGGYNDPYNMALPMPTNNNVSAQHASRNYKSGNITHKASNKRQMNVGQKTQPTMAIPFILNRRILTNKGNTAQTRKNTTLKSSAGQRRLTIGGRRSTKNQTKKPNQS